jgi:hypothetical protein
MNSDERDSMILFLLLFILFHLNILLLFYLRLNRPNITSAFLLAFIIIKPNIYTLQLRKKVIEFIL